MIRWKKTESTYWLVQAARPASLQHQAPAQEMEVRLRPGRAQAWSDQQPAVFDPLKTTCFCGWPYR